MEKRTCLSCNQLIEVKETENKGEFKFPTHYRVRTFRDYEDGDDDYDRGVHMRNIVDILCEGSGKISLNRPPENSFFSGHGG